jgi:hypothetical protein
MSDPFLFLDNSRGNDVTLVAIFKHDGGGLRFSD